MTNKNIIAVEKRGGMRKVIRRRPTAKSNPSDYFKEKKSFLPKKLTQYRFLISTDFTSDDLLFLTVFTAWVKANEKFFDDRNNFPIYGFITGNCANNKVRAQRIREFLTIFADTLSWNDPEHHLYNGYLSAGNRIWFEGSSDQYDESQLVENKSIVDDDNYPKCQSLEEGLDELSGVKASNIFLINLRHLQYSDERFLTFLKGCKGITCDYTQDTLIKAAPFNEYINQNNCKKLFTELSDEDQPLLKMLRASMFSYNDYQITKYSKLLPTATFGDVDWEDYKSFKKVCAENNVSEYSETIKILDHILKHNSESFNTNSAGLMLNLLKLGGTIEKINTSTLNNILGVAINLL